MKVKDVMTKDPIAIDSEAAVGTALDVMRTLKHALDPDDLMNPGKIVAF